VSRRTAIAAAAAACLALPVDARPSSLLVRTSGAARLSVTLSGAEVTYVEAGVTKTLVASGAINARFPQRNAQQVRFTIAYGAHLDGAACSAYDGPPLRYLVAACKAPDGSYWALQRWARALPIYGQPPTGIRGIPELRLSHWSGPLAVLTVKQDWAFRVYDHLYGSVKYLGHPMHGFGTSQFGAPHDSFGVLVYVDTLNSAYGPGWRRENGFVTHNPNGIYCYGFYSHKVPGRPSSFPSGNGERYRVTAVGPGVLPDLVWEADARGSYDRAADRLANLEQKQKYTDRICHAN
jgi:hypothetical protein